jgi:flagellar biogenesis protein FliO
MSTNTTTTKPKRSKWMMIALAVIIFVIWLVVNAGS